MKIEIEMPDSARAANIAIVFDNGANGITLFSHAFDPKNSLLIDWEDEEKVKLKAEVVSK